MEQYKNILKKAEELAAERAKRLVSASDQKGDDNQKGDGGEKFFSKEESREFNNWAARYNSISLSKAWRKIWFKRHRKAIYGWSSAAVVLLSLAISLFITNHNRESLLVAEEVIMPASGSVILKTSSGEMIVIDSIQSSDTTVRNLIVSHTQLTYRGESEEGVELDRELDDKGKERKSVEKREEREEINELFVPKGRVYSLLLSDGTTVWLNSETHIKYPVQFKGKERVVTLSGEALFDVAKDGNTFVVKTANYSVNVLGTKFNIISYEDEELSSTTLIEGAVSIATDNENHFTIAPGKQFSLDKSTNEIVVKEVDVNLYTSWIDNQLKLQDSSLEDIFRILKRKYHIDVLFSDEKAKHELFTGEVPLNDNLLVILNQLSLVSNVVFNIEDSLVTVGYK